MHTLHGQSINQRTEQQTAPRAADSSLAELDMASSGLFLLTALLALITSGAVASDPSPLQDFCVADKHSPGTRFIIRAIL